MGKKTTEISERILQVIDFYKTNSNSFAKVLGYSRSQAVYDMISGKAKPSYDFFNRFILSEYSASINTDWFIAGVGEMLKANNNKSEVIYKSDPRDADLIAANKEVIETQRDLIASLKLRIKELEHRPTHTRDKGLGSAPTVGLRSTDLEGHKTE